MRKKTTIPRTLYSKAQTDLIVTHYGTEKTVLEISEMVFGKQEDPIKAAENVLRIRRQASNFRRQGKPMKSYPIKEPRPVGYVRLRNGVTTQVKTEKGWVTIPMPPKPMVEKLKNNNIKKRPIAALKKAVPSSNTRGGDKVAGSMQKMAKKHHSEVIGLGLNGKNAQRVKKYSHDENPDGWEITAPKVPMKRFQVAKGLWVEAPETDTQEDVIKRYYDRINSKQR